LRLFQNSVPKYAQVRHGPIEYGKDIVVAVAENDHTTLRMYQAKCGDLKMAGWNGVKPQLEQMFQVPLDSFQLPISIDRRVGVIVWNGHANPHVEPVIEGWAAEQLRDHCHQFEFMHLDRVVNYIFDHHLVSALREALAEQNVTIV
jgi:hypothetical protein